MFWLLSLAEMSKKKCSSVKNMTGKKKKQTYTKTKQNKKIELQKTEASLHILVFTIIVSMPSAATPQSLKYCDVIDLQFSTSSLKV